MTKMALDFDHGDLELIVGTYEDYVVGYQVEQIATKSTTTSNGTPATKKRKKNDPLPTENGSSNEVGKSSLDLEQSFAVRGHSGSVRCLAASSNGSLVFSSGYDEMMNLFNLKKRKLLHTLEGAVECATFVESSHLICGYDDGNIRIFECKNSSLILAKTLKGHKAAVTSIDCHPSGKVLLSISKDRTMRTWNLIKGRCAYVTQLKNDSHLIRWSRTGEEFLIAANNEIYLSNSAGNLRRSIKLEKRVNCIEFITEAIFAVAIDSGKLEFFDLRQDECPSIFQLEAHSTRIKSIKCLSGLPKNSDHDKDSRRTLRDDTRFATAASDGSMKIWSVTELSDSLDNCKELVSVDIGVRITCMIASTRRMSK